MQLKAIGALLKDAANEWLADKASRLGAALAYYTLFSLAPLLVLVIGIAGLVFGQQAVRGDLDKQMKTAFGEPAAAAIDNLLKNTEQTGTGPWATAIGFVVLFFARRVCSCSCKTPSIRSGRSCRNRDDPSGACLWIAGCRFF